MKNLTVNSNSIIAKNGKTTTTFNYYLEPMFSHKTLDLLEKAMDALDDKNDEEVSEATSKEDYLAIMEQHLLARKELINFCHLFKGKGFISIWAKEADKNVLYDALQDAFTQLLLKYDIILKNADDSTTFHRYKTDKWDTEECLIQLTAFVNQNSVAKPNLQSEMGVSFMEWADDYLSNRLNVEFNKKQALEHLKTTQNALKNISSNNFIKRVKAWCKFNSHDFMPKAKTDDNGHIKKKNDEGKWEEFLFINSK